MFAPQPDMYIFPQISTKNAAGEILISGEPFPKTVEYEIDWNNSTVAAPITFSFNTRGISSVESDISVYIDRDKDGTQDIIPDYDCITIRTTRINLGKLEIHDTANRADDECIIK